MKLKNTEEQIAFASHQGGDDVVAVLDRVKEARGCLR